MKKSSESFDLSSCSDVQPEIRCNRDGRTLTLTIRIPSSVGPEDDDEKNDIATKNSRKLNRRKSLSPTTSKATTSKSKISRSHSSNSRTSKSGSPQKIKKSRKRSKDSSEHDGGIESFLLSNPDFLNSIIAQAQAAFADSERHRGEISSDDAALPFSRSCRNLAGTAYICLPFSASKFHGSGNGPPGSERDPVRNNEVPPPTPAPPPTLTTSSFQFMPEPDNGPTTFKSETMEQPKTVIHEMLEVQEAPTPNLDKMEKPGEILSETMETLQVLANQTALAPRAEMVTPSDNTSDILSKIKEQMDSSSFKNISSEMNVQGETEISFHIVESKFTIKQSNPTRSDITGSPLTTSQQGGAVVELPLDENRIDFAPGTECTCTPQCVCDNGENVEEGTHPNPAMSAQGGVIELVLEDDAGDFGTPPTTPKDGVIELTLEEDTAESAPGTDCTCRPCRCDYNDAGVQTGAPPTTSGEDVTEFGLEEDASDFEPETDCTCESQCECDKNDTAVQAGSHPTTPKEVLRGLSLKDETAALVPGTDCTCNPCQCDDNNDGGVQTGTPEIVALESVIKLGMEEETADFGPGTDCSCRPQCECEYGEGAPDQTPKLGKMTDGFTQTFSSETEDEQLLYDEPVQSDRCDSNAPPSSNFYCPMSHLPSTQFLNSLITEAFARAVERYGGQVEIPTQAESRFTQSCPNFAETPDFPPPFSTSKLQDRGCGTLELDEERGPATNNEVPPSALPTSSFQFELEPDNDSFIDNPSDTSEEIKIPGLERESLHEVESIVFIKESKNRSTSVQTGTPPITLQESVVELPSEEDAVDLAPGTDCTCRPQCLCDYIEDAPEPEPTPKLDNAKTIKDGFNQTCSTEDEQLLRNQPPPSDLYDPNAPLSPDLYCPPSTPYYAPPFPDFYCPPPTLYDAPPSLNSYCPPPGPYSAPPSPNSYFPPPGPYNALPSPNSYYPSQVPYNQPTSPNSYCPPPGPYNTPPRSPNSYFPPQNPYYTHPNPYYSQPSPNCYFVDRRGRLNHPACPPPSPVCQERRVTPPHSQHCNDHPRQASWLEQATVKVIRHPVQLSPSFSPPHCPPTRRGNNTPPPKATKCWKDPNCGNKRN